MGSTQGLGHSETDLLLGFLLPPQQSLIRSSRMAHCWANDKGEGKGGVRDMKTQLSLFGWILVSNGVTVVTILCVTFVF